MKTISELEGTIKIAIRSEIVGCSCKFKGKDRNIIKFGSFQTHFGFSFTDKIDLAVIPVNGSITTSVRFVVFLYFDMGEDNKAGDWTDGQFGPITISHDSDEYNVDMTNATISGLST